MSVLRSDYLRLDAIDARIYMAIRDDGPLDQADLLDRFRDHSLATIVQRLHALVAAGLIDERTHGQRRSYQVTQLLGPWRRMWARLWARKNILDDTAPGP